MAIQEIGEHGLWRALRAMGQVLELLEDTYQLLIELPHRQHRTPEEIVRALLLDYELEKYRQVNQRMLAQGLLIASLTTHLLRADDFEPESIPGKALSEIIIEERR
jgi:hypothetical protein